MSNVIEFKLPKKDDPSEFNVACILCDSAAFEIKMNGVISCLDCDYMMGTIFDLSDAIKERL